MAAVLFVLMNLAAAGTSLFIARAFFHDEDPGVRFLIALALFPVVVVLTLIVLGLTYMLSAMMALLMVLAVGAIVYFARVRGQSKRPAPGIGGQGVDTLKALFDSLEGRFSLALLLFAAAPTIGRALFVGPHFSVDDLWYHAPFVTWWMQHGGITYEHSHELTSYYPFNAELFALWFVLPFGRDAFATFAGAFWGILLVVSLVVLLRAIGRSLAQSLLLPALLITLPIVPVSLLRYAAVDLVGVSAIIAAMTVVLSGKPSPRIWFMAGLIAGFAVGSKVTFVAGASVLALWIILGPAHGAGIMRRLHGALYHLAGLILTGSFWYLHNLWLSGNPTFPAAVGPFSGPMPGEYLSSTALAAWLSATNLDGPTLQEFVRAHIDWPWPHFLAGVIGVVSLFVLLVTRRLPQAERRLGTLALLMIVVSLAVFVFMPSSKPSDMGGGILEAKHRFLILPATLALLCLTLASTRTKKGGHFYILATTLLVLLVWPGSLLMALAIAAVLSAVILGWKRLYRLGERFQIRRYGFLLLASVFVGFAIWQPFAQRRTDERLLATGHEASPAWKALGELPDGAQIASIGSSSENIYPLFGRDLSLHPVVVSRQGDLRQPLHEAWKEDPSQIEWQEEGPSANLQALIPNMRRAGVSYLYVSRLKNGQWPQHLEHIKVLGDSCLLYRDEKVQIWRLPR